MKKLICILLCLVLATTVLASCKNEPTETSSTAPESSAPVAESSEQSEEEYVLFSNLPDKDYGDSTFTILVEGDYLDRYKSVEIMPHELSPKVISEAVADRNALVEERFGVKIAEIRTTGGSEILTSLRANHTGGTNLYDAAMPFMPEAATLSLEGVFRDLTQCENINLDGDYWDSSAKRDLSIGGSLYFVAGDTNLLAYDCTSCIIFNKDMIKENSLEDPYELVKSNQWTLDKLYTMSKDITKESSGSDPMNLDDTWGFLTNAGIATTLFVGCGERLSRKNTEDLPVISLQGDKQVSVFNKIFDICNDPKVGIIEDYTSDYPGNPDVYGKASECVATKNAMFRTMVVVDISEMGNYECNFGIIPVPKLSEEQEDYFSYVSTIYASACAIPVNCPDGEKSEIIIDALCQASTKTLKTAYYDNMLKLRKLQDADGEAMLDKIFDSRVYDFGAIFGWGGTGKWDTKSISNFMYVICQSGSNTYASTLDGLDEAFQADRDKTVAALG